MQVKDQLKTLEDPEIANNWKLGSNSWIELKGISNEKEVSRIGRARWKKGKGKEKYDGTKPMR